MRLSSNNSDSETTLRATDAKTNFGTCMDEAQIGPILVEKNGRPYVYIISKKEYDALKAIEDSYWAKEAKDGQNSGYLSEEETENFFRKRLSAKEETVKKG